MYSLESAIGVAGAGGKLHLGAAGSAEQLKQQRHGTPFPTPPGPLPELSGDPPEGSPGAAAAAQAHGSLPAPEVRPNPLCSLVSNQETVSGAQLLVQPGSAAVSRCQMPASARCNACASRKHHMLKTMLLQALSAFLVPEAGLIAWVQPEHLVFSDSRYAKLHAICQISTAS